METIIEFFNMAMAGLSGVGDQFDSWADRATLWAVVGYLNVKLFMLDMSYSIASVMIENIGISSYIESAWESLDSSILSVFTYLRIPDGLNAIISAAMTRFVMDLF